MMRVAQMLDTLYWGGAQKMQLFLVQTLRPLGIDITVINLAVSPDDPISELLMESGARVVNFPFNRLFSPVSFLNLVNFLRVERFDLLHAYLTHSNTIGPLAGSLTGTPTIASLRSADFDHQSQPRRREIVEALAIRLFASRVMANGLAVAEFARQRLKNRCSIDIVPNAVDFVPELPESERQALRQDLTGDPSRPLVLSVGRLTSAKGFPDLIEAFSILHAQFPTAALVIAGGGTLSDDLNQQINTLGLQEQVFMLGQRSDVPRLLAAADVYVNSSHWEGTPVSVLEAMSAGLPVVATSVGESPYLLADGMGLLVPPHQPAEIARALSALLASPDMRSQLGQAARHHVRQHYSRENWCRNLLELYAQVTPSAQPYLARLSSTL